MTADERRRLRRSIWLLVAVFVAVGLLDTAADHEPMRPAADGNPSETVRLLALLASITTTN